MAKSQPCCVGDWLSSGVEGMEQCMRCGEINLAGQGEPHLALLYKSHVQIKQPCEFFNMCRCGASHLRTL